MSDAVSAAREDETMMMLVIGSGASEVDAVREADGSDPDCWKLASFLFPRQVREWQSGMGTRGESRWCVLVDATEEDLDRDAATIAYRTVNDFDLALGACGVDPSDDVLRVERVERMVNAGAIG